jgi:hypothetical protein
MRHVLVVSFAILLSLAALSPAQAAITLVTGAGAQTDSVSLGASAGDLIICLAVGTSGTIPSKPADFTDIDTFDLTAFEGRIAYRVATATEDSGTWANATRIACAVFRGQHATTPLPLGTAYIETAGSGTSMDYAGITLSVTNGTSWVAGFGVHKTAVTNGGNVAPTGMTNHGASGATAPRAGAHSTNTGVSSWAGATATASASDVWVTYVMEIVAASGGGGCTRGRRSLLGVGC